MFTLPPFPPKDFVIKDVTKSLQSSSQFTPSAELRVTQSNLGKYCFPIEYGKNEYPNNLDETAQIEPIILKKWTNEARAEWVTAPGKDDFFLHDLFRKYSTIQDHRSWDPRFMHKEKVFNRPYKVELDCIEAARLEKLRAKSEKEDEEFENSFQQLINRQKCKEKPRIQVTSCENQSPFWWKQDENESKLKRGNCNEKPETRNATKDIASSSKIRWQEEPNLTAFVKDDPCRRKFDMHIVGQPFKNEACNWYYKNYPPPDIKFLPRKTM